MKKKKECFLGAVGKDQGRQESLNRESVRKAWTQSQWMAGSGCEVGQVTSSVWAFNFTCQLGWAVVPRGLVKFFFLIYFCIEG